MFTIFPFGAARGKSLSTGWAERFIILLSLMFWILTSYLFIKV